MTERENFTETKELQFKNALISILSHDAKGLLANVFWMIEAIESGMASPDTLQELISELKCIADKNAELFNETITWIKIQQNDFSVNKEHVNLHTLYEDLRLYFSASLAGKQLQLSFSGNADDTLFTDSTIIIFILKYIIQEAINFSEKGKNIIFKTEKDRQQIEIDFFAGKNDFSLPAISFAEHENNNLPEHKPDVQSKYIKDFLDLLKGTIKVARYDDTNVQWRLSLPL